MERVNEPLEDRRAHTFLGTRFFGQRLQKDGQLDGQTDKRRDVRTDFPCILQDIVSFGAAAQSFLKLQL